MLFNNIYGQILTILNVFLLIISKCSGSTISNSSYNLKFFNGDDGKKECKGLNGGPRPSILGNDKTSALTGETYTAYTAVRYAEETERYKVGEVADNLDPDLSYEFKGLSIACIQTLPGGIPFGEEDCYFLDIYVPEVCEGKISPCPVLVFIHGGSFVNGYTGTFVPDFLMRKHESFIVVVVAYPLGPFGWLSLNNEVAPGNAGTLNVILAFQWIQNNIGYFDGDCSRVTAYGQSAGGAIVLQMLYSPVSLQSPPLFTNAIVMSGSHNAAWALHRGDYVQEATDFAQLLFDKGHCGPCGPVLDVLDCLQCALAEDVRKVFYEERANQLEIFNINYLSTPTILTNEDLCSDKRVYCVDPDTNLINGNYNQKVNLFIGTNHDDGSFVLLIAFQVLCNLDPVYCYENIFTPVNILLKYADLILFVLGGTTDTSEYLNDKCIIAQGQSLDAFTRVISAILFERSTYRIARFHSQNGGVAYVYRFDRKHSNAAYTAFPNPPINLGVAHGNELFFIWPPNGYAVINNYIDADMNVVESLTQFMSDFIHKGNPNVNDFPGQYWPKFHSSFNFICNFFPSGPICDRYLVIDSNLMPTYDYSAIYTCNNP